MPTPQFVDDLRARIVLEAAQILQTECTDRLELVILKVGMKHHIRQDLQRRNQITRHCRTRERRVQRLCALGVADPQIVKRCQKLSAVARPSSSSDPLGRHRRGPAFQVQTESTLIRRPCRQQ